VTKLSEEQFEASEMIQIWYSWAESWCCCWYLKEAK